MKLFTTFFILFIVLTTVYTLQSDITGNISYSIKTSNSNTENKVDEFMLSQLELIREVCEDYVYRTDDEFDFFLEKLSDSESSEETYMLMVAEVKNTNKLFSYKQLMEVFTILKYEEEQEEAIYIFKDQLANVTAGELIYLIDQIDYTNPEYVNQFLKVLGKSYVEELYKMTLSKSEEVANRFTELAYTDNAYLVIEDFRADCDEFFDGEEFEYNEDDFQEDEDLFGDAEKENRTMFIIDVSGSMKKQFSIQSVQKTRLAHVKSELIKTLQKMDHSTMFNISTFNSNYKIWQDTFIEATPENIELAIEWINSLKPNGGTNMQKAFNNLLMDKSDQMEHVYVLCDGHVNIDNIPNMISKIQSDRETQIQIHTISFANGKNLKLKKIAHLSGGHYRTYQ